MKIKLLTLILSTLLCLSGLVTPVHAEGESETSKTTLEDKAGITPDSVLYPIDQLLDEIKVVLSFKDGSKIETLLDIAQERLAESEVMTAAGKDKESQKTLEAYNTKTSEASDKLDDIVSKNSEVEDYKKAEEIAALEEKVAQYQESSLEVLEGMIEKVSEDSKEILAKVIEMQTEKKEAIKAMLEARHELNAAKKQYNEAKASIKKVEKSTNEEQIKNAQENLASIKETFNLKREEYNIAFKAKQEVVKTYSEDKNIDPGEDSTSSPESTDTIKTDSIDSSKSTETLNKEINSDKEVKKSSPVEKTEKASEEKQPLKKDDSKGDKTKENSSENQNKQNGKGKN